MSTTVTKGTLIVKEILNKLTGDDNQAIANYNARKAISAVESQLAALKALQVDNELAVTDAEEAYKAALYPTEKITDGKYYIQAIKVAQEKLDAAKEALENTKKTTEYFQNLLDTKY